MNARKRGLLERLCDGVVICAEGYLFEMERRGYLQAGAFVPEVVLDHPEVVAQLRQGVKGMVEDEGPGQFITPREGTRAGSLEVGTERMLPCACASPPSG